MIRPRLIVVLLIFLASRSLAQSNQPLPTLNEIEADFNAGKYQDVIKKSQRALAVKKDSAKDSSKDSARDTAKESPQAAPVQDPDRAAIEALRGNAYLNLKQNAPAVEAFLAAAKDTADPKDVGLYRATALLIKRSRGTTYVPKATAAGGAAAPGAAAPAAPGAGAGAAGDKDKVQGIDIVALDSRKKAFAALYTDESKTVSNKVEAIRQKQSLKQIMDVLHDVLDLRAVELAGTDSDDGTKKMVADVSDQAAKLMGEAVKNLSATVDKIDKSANETSSHSRSRAYGPSDTIVSKRGLSSTDKKTLEDIIASCKDVEVATEQITSALNDKAGAIGEVKTSTTALATHANEVLKADYGDIKSNSDNSAARTGGQGNTGSTGNTGNTGSNQNPQQPRHN